MASIIFNDFYIFIPILSLFSFFWLIFLKTLNNVNIFLEKNIVVCNIEPTKQTYFFTLVKHYLLITTTSCIVLFLIHGKNKVLWFNHFNLSSFNTRFFLFFVIISFTFYFLLYSTVFNKISYSLDFFFALLNLILLLPILFISNNLFTFLFVLETISCFLFYKLISSKIWYKSQIKETFFKVYNNIPTLFLNMVFFQYWITFFATIFVIFTLTNIIYIFGSSEWFIFNFINNSLYHTIYFTNNTVLYVIAIVFILSILLKLGISPFHLFKVETYKGVPYLSILFYTTYYFVVVFCLFVFLLNEHFLSFVSYYYYLFLFTLSAGFIYIIVLFFDINFLKAFFAYSTVINSLSFLVLFVSNF